MNKRKFFTVIASSALVLAGCATERSSDRVARRRSIDAEADFAIARLFEKTRGSRELVERARGVLVFPTVVTAGLVVGGSHGDGVLRSGSNSVAFYSTSSASVGLTIGAQSKSIFVLFLTDDSLQKFQSSEGWTVGADASIALISAGAGGVIDTQTIQRPVVGFVLNNGGLMADLSLEGTKVRRLDL